MPYYAPAGMANPLQAQDDLIVGGAAGAPARLAKGADSQVLTVDPTTHHLLWAAPAAGFSDPTTSKGDLIVHGATTTRLPAGSDGQVLTADSTQAAGLAYATPAAGGSLAFVAEQVAVGAVSALSFSSIPAGYRDLLLSIVGRCDLGATSCNVSLQFNGDTGSDYTYAYLYAWNNGSAEAGGAAQGSIVLGAVAGSLAVANDPGAIEARISDYAGTTWNKVVMSRCYQRVDTTAGGQYGYMAGGVWASTAAITSLRLLVSGANWLAGSRATLWGAKNA